MPDFESLLNTSIKKNKIPNSQIVSVHQLAGDASTRCYYRLKTADDSYIVCIDKPVTESPFLNVQSEFKNGGVRVPEVYDFDLSRGYYLQEDLSDETLLRRLASIHSTDEEFDLYKKAVDEQIKINKINPQNFKLSFDEEKLMFEVLFNIEHFIKGYLKYTPSIKEEKIIIDNFLAIVSKIVEEPRVVTHRDYHSRNIMIKNEELRIIDFQDARLGIHQYDLASLLDDCYYSLDEQNVQKLKKYYFENVDYHESFEHFMYYYDLMEIQRVFKAIGSFGYIYQSKHSNRYLKYVGYAFEKLRKVLNQYPEYTELKNTLSRIYYEY